MALGTDGLSLAEIEAARPRIAGFALRTPLVRFGGESGERSIHLKLENLQPIGSFKVRGAANAMRLLPANALADGVYTASAGNMAQGVAWVAQRMGVPCSVVVPDHAPRTKLEAIARFGARIIKVPFDEWWMVLVEHRFDGVTGTFIHPVSDRPVIAGNGTAGLEILDKLPDVDVVLVPFGGGGLSCGIASAIRASAPGVRVIACEVETAAPFAASLAAGEPRTIDYTPSFVDGIGGKSVLAEMWPMARRLLAGSVVVSLDEIRDAIRLLATHNRVIAEGAGAAALAAAMSGRVAGARIACVVSGGNIDRETLAGILA